MPLSFQALLSRFRVVQQLLKPKLARFFLELCTGHPKQVNFTNTETSHLKQINFTNTHAHTINIQSMDDMSKNRALERKLSEFWDLEAIGIQPQTRQKEKFNKCEDSLYNAKLPKRECHKTLPFNYTLCKNI